MSNSRGLYDITKVTVILKEIDDELMLKYMGRENGEDYSTHFLVMLNTGEGAVGFFQRSGKKSQPIK